MFSANCHFLPLLRQKARPPPGKMKDCEISCQFAGRAQIVKSHDLPGKRHPCQFILSLTTGWLLAFSLFFNGESNFDVNGYE